MAGTPQTLPVTGWLGAGSTWRQTSMAKAHRGANRQPVRRPGSVSTSPGRTPRRRVRATEGSGTGMADRRAAV